MKASERARAGVVRRRASGIASSKARRTCSRLRSPRSVMMRECLPRRGRPGAARVLAMAGRLKPNRDKTAFNPPTGTVPARYSPAANSAANRRLLARIALTNCPYICVRARSTIIGPALVSRESQTISTLEAAVKNRPCFDRRGFRRRVQRAPVSSSTPRPQPTSSSANIMAAIASTASVARVVAARAGKAPKRAAKASLPVSTRRAAKIVANADASMGGVAGFGDPLPASAPIPPQQVFNAASIKVSARPRADPSDFR